jgi:hypothetical protein
MENVLSEMANSVARFVMLGIWLGAYPPMHAYGGVVVAAQPPTLDVLPAVHQRHAAHDVHGRELAGDRMINVRHRIRHDVGE